MFPHWSLSQKKKQQTFLFSFNSTLLSFGRFTKFQEREEEEKKKILKKSIPERRKKIVKKSLIRIWICVSFPTVSAQLQLTTEPAV